MPNTASLDNLEEEIFIQVKKKKIIPIPSHEHILCLELGIKIDPDLQKTDSFFVDLISVIKDLPGLDFIKPMFIKNSVKLYLYLLDETSVNTTRKILEKYSSDHINDYLVLLDSWIISSSSKKNYNLPKTSNSDSSSWRR